MKSALTIEDISIEIASGVACSLSKVVPDGVLHLRPFSVTEDGRLCISDAPRIPQSVVPTNKSRFEVGDIIFNNTNSVELVGKSAVFSTGLDASFSNHMTRIRLDRRKAEPGYVHAFLRHLYGRRFFQDRATRWVSQAAFGAAQLKALKLSLPPLQEQRRIAGLLHRAEAIQRRANDARATARSIIPSLFYDTFGDPAANPNGWPTAAIGEVVKLTGGGTPSKANPEFWNGTIPWVSPKDMKLPTITDSEDKITAAGMAASPVKLIPAGNVLIVVRGMILAHTVPIRMNVVDVTLNQDMKALIPDKQILPVFLRWALGSLHGYLLSKVRESAHGTKKLETSVLTSYPIIIPPMQLQKAFAEHVLRLELLADYLDAASGKADAMAAGLSAEFFGPPPN